MDAEDFKFLCIMLMMFVYWALIDVDLSKIHKLLTKEDDTKEDQDDEDN